MGEKSKGTKTGIASAFLVTSFSFFVVAIFYGFWASNDYQFYERHKFRMRAYNERMRTRRQQRDEQLDTTEERKVSGRELNYHSPREQSEQGREENRNTEEAVSESETYIDMVAPKTKRDWIVLIIFWVNFAVLTIVLVINCGMFDPIWIPLAFYFWVLIIEFGLLGLSKYYYSNYSFSKTWFYVSFAVMLVLYIASTVAFIIGASQQKNKTKRDIIIILLLVLHVIFVPGTLIYFCLYLPFRYNSQNDTFQ